MISGDLRNLACICVKTSGFAFEAILVFACTAGFYLAIMQAVASSRQFVKSIPDELTSIFFVQNKSEDIVSKTLFFRSYRTLSGLLFVAGLVLAFGVPFLGLTNAQDHGHFVKAQSQDIELPEDFMVRVDGNKLQVALVSLGAIDTKMSTSSVLVRLLNSNGDEKEARANNQGIVEFEGVQPDELHALLVVDEKAHAAVPLMTVGVQTAAKRKTTAKNIRLPLMPSNPQEIMASINRGILPNSNSQGGELYAASDYSLQSVNPYSVRLQRDGTLLGKVVVADRDLAEMLRYAKLTFLQNNKVVARTDSNPKDGSFSVAGFAPGLYGVIAAGPAGYASFAFDVLAPARPALLGEGILGRPVSFVQADSNEKLYVFLCPPKLVPKITDRCREAYGQPIADAAGVQPVSGLTVGNGAGLAAGGFGGGGFGGGGFGGGGFGGGGGGLGGGGLGGLLGIGGLIAVGVAAGTNNRNASTTTVSTITP